MNRLPEGYYAVISKNEDGTLKNILSFKGIDYETCEGTNAFGTIAEAYAAAGTTPTTVLEGLDYESFTAPVILFDAGSFPVDGLLLTKSAYFLGQKAGVTPNVFSENALQAPSLNPEWENGLSRLTGSYWKGYMTAAAPEAELLVFDGFANRDARYTDKRKEGGTLSVVFRNIMHEDFSGHNLYLFSTSKNYDLRLRMENIRLSDFDDFDYGVNFCRVNASEAVFENICYNNTQQLFGLTGYSRTYNNAAGREKSSVYTFRHCYFGKLRGEHGLSGTCKPECGSGVVLNLDDCFFVDAARENEPFLTPNLENKNCSVNIKDCRFVDTRKGNPCAILVYGNRNCRNAEIGIADAVCDCENGKNADSNLEKENQNAVINCCDGWNIHTENCSFEGFLSVTGKAPEPETDAPDYIGEVMTEPCGEPLDAHELSDDRDFSVLDEMYGGTKAYYGDLHVHSNSGGTSDGKTPIEEYVAGMDREQLDFVALVDHRQMRGFFLPAWDEERMIIGTEPGTRILDLKACRHGQNEIHYNMLFPHKYGLAMVLANFPEFEFRGDELTGSFKYPKFTVARFNELCRYVESIGGLVVHPHPKTMMASADPLDYYECFGEHTFIETLYTGYDSAASAKNYKLWCELLAAGKHIYTSSGSDSHSAVTHSTVATFYTKEKNGLAFFKKMKSADFAVGAFGMQLEIDGNPMGSEISYREGQILKLRIGDFFAPAFKENNAYELRIYSDEGLCYSSRFNGKYPQSLALRLKKRRFYRAEIYDVTRGCRIGIGNPIWLDK